MSKLSASKFSAAFSTLSEVRSSRVILGHVVVVWRDGSRNIYSTVGEAAEHLSLFS